MATPKSARGRRSASSSATPEVKSRSASPAAGHASVPKRDGEYAEGTNWVAGGMEENAMLFALICLAPFLTVLLGYLTSPEFKATGQTPYLTTMVPACFANVTACTSGLADAFASMYPPALTSVKFVLSFLAVAALLELLPGNIEVGPETLTGHIPKYTDNGVRHMVAYTFLFYAGSNDLGWGKDLLPESLQYGFGVMYDVFPGAVAFLNVFGICFCIFLTVKGLYFPSTADSGSSGSRVKDFLWGTELYPRIFNWDLKRFINCRFSMTFWQIAGFSFAYKSFQMHNDIDYALLFSAISQYIYLVKFFWWEMGYMRSIDIIVDRAGFEIQWGCLVWVPAVYTLHTRFCVLYPSGISFPMAVLLFIISVAGVLCNYAADREREIFRATNGQALVWGQKPKYIEAEYSIIDRQSGKETKKKSLLLASGFWGVARHFQYLFELIAAWAWCLMANPFKNGVIPLFYAVFLTYLLFDRANRDSKKCHLKYGKYYEEYCKLVPYKIIPGIY